MLTDRRIMTASNPGSRHAPGPSLVFTLEGARLRANEAARRLLAQVPLLGDELTRIVREFAASSHMIEVSAGGHRYIVRRTFVEAGLMGDDDVVLVTLVPAASHDDVAAVARRCRLTARQTEVARLLLARRSNREIADQLGVSFHTARNHVQTVLDKLGVSSRAQARRLLEPRDPAQ